jgi:hypothetical protein
LKERPAEIAAGEEEGEIISVMRNYPRLRRGALVKFFCTRFMGYYVSTDI